MTSTHRQRTTKINQRIQFGRKITIVAMMLFVSMAYAVTEPVSAEPEVLNEDGTRVRLSDGTIAEYNQDGSFTITDPEGNTTIIEREGKIAIPDLDDPYPESDYESEIIPNEDGSTTVKFPDGTTETYPPGTTVDPNGGGTVTVTDPEGNEKIVGNFPDPPLPKDPDQRSGSGGGGNESAIGPIALIISLLAVVTMFVITKRQKQTLVTPQMAR